MDEPAHITAAARWIELGATSATNPALGYLLHEVFEPLGIRCEYMECDPLTHENVLILPTFVAPTWRRDGVRPEFAALCPDDEIAGFYKVAVNRSGQVVFTPSVGDAAPKFLAAMDRFNNGDALNLVLEKSRQAIARFLVAVFEKTCLPASPEELSRAFVADPLAVVKREWASV